MVRTRSHRLRKKQRLSESHSNEASNDDVTTNETVQDVNVPKSDVHVPKSDVTDETDDVNKPDTVEENEENQQEVDYDMLLKASTTIR